MAYDQVFSKEERAIIAHEYERLKDVCYLDNTGTALYSSSYIESVMKELMVNVFSNPHSNSLTGKYCSDTTDIVRYKVLQHFNTDMDEYSVIFTSGATGALKLIAESFCWNNDAGNTNNWHTKDKLWKERSGDFVYMEDNHTSVLGMRDVVRERGANVKCLRHNEILDIFIDNIDKKDLDVEKSNLNSLFVYSAQCNFSGVKYPLSWLEKVRNGILDTSQTNVSNWFTLLDAATYISTNPLDLGKYKPDFVCISFYKLFGYPTGLGALLVRNASAHLLRKSYYGGGTVLISLSSERFHVPRPLLHERFEDGSLNFLSILSLNMGFEKLYSLVGSMERISKHSFYLAKYLFYSLLKLHHSNGIPAVHIYCDTAYDDINTQGNIVTFNVLRPNGDFVGYAEVMHMANLYGIQLRTGCFCNPGACRRHLGLSNEELRKHFQLGHVCGDENDLVNGSPTGAVRASFSFYNGYADADRLLKMIVECYVQQPVIHRDPFLWEFISMNLKNKFKATEEDKLAQIRKIDFSKYLDNWPGFSCHRPPETLVYNESNPQIEPFKLLPTFTRENESQLTHMFIYPIKSCGKFRVTQWQLSDRGLNYDRHWMIVNRSGLALTQKREQKMCLIRPTVDPNLNILRLSFQGYPDISINIKDESKHWSTDASLCQSKVCGDRVQGIDCGDEVASWLSLVLERPGLRLVRQLAEDNRANKKTNESLTLANQAQYLLVNESSIDWLIDRLDNFDSDKESLLDRFRCNFVISQTGEAFDEQKWEKVRIGGVDFNVDGACGRCQMICINQDTGEYNKEPLTVLAANSSGKLKFGIYLSKATENCGAHHTITVGDHFSLIK